MNLNNLAKEITLEEGKKVSVSIAQVKEIMRITFTKLSEMSMMELEKLINRYKK